MSERAVSEVLSYSLVFGLILSSVAVVSVAGLGSLQDTRDAEQMENAERAFDVLADNVADIHQRGAPSRATEISLGQQQLVTGENVTVTVDVDEGSGFNTVGSWTVRPIEYRGNRERAIAYELGAVFRTTRDGGVVVREPPFIVRSDRVLVPVVGLNRPTQQSLGGSTVLVRTDERRTEMAYANATGAADEIRITLTDSPRQSLWADYFSRVCDDTATTANTVSCEYGSGINRVYVVYHDIAVNIDQ